MSNGKLIVDIDNVFARVLDYYMDLEFINDKELADELEIPISQVIDMRLGIIWGTVTPEIVKKLDTIFNVEQNFFLKTLRQTLIK